MKVVIAARWQEPGCVEVQAAFPKVEFAIAKTPEELVREATNAEAIFGWPDREAIRAARQLRWVQAHSAGMDWITGNVELLESDVLVTSMGAAFAATMVEHVFGLLLSLTRGLRYFEAEQCRRAWTRPLGVPLLGLAGRTLGILGFGNIGRRVADVGRAFGMQVVAVDAHDVARPEYLAAFWGLEGLSDLLRESDVLIVTVPLTSETRGMLGAERLSLMKPSALLIGISRGEIIDERALVRMLKESRLAGAALDAFAAEPLPPESDLWDAPNLILTPHCSGVSSQTTDGCWQMWKDNLGRYLDGRPLLNVFDKRRGY